MSGKSAQGHHVEVVPSTQRVRVTIDGRQVADTTSALLVYETGMPVRYYLPPGDVDLTLLTPTDTHTTCPFKGEASYWSYTGGGAGQPERTDVVWAYQEPIDAVAPIKGYLSFYDTVAEIAVEGEPPSGS